jgi:hypothetical protein
MNKMKSKSKSTNGAVVSDEPLFSEDISESKVIDERIKINGHRIRKGKNIVRLYSRNISIEEHDLINLPAILYLNNGAMSGNIRRSKYISEDELEVLFVDNNKKAKEKEAEAEKKNKWLEDQVNDQDNNGMSSYATLVVYKNKLAAKPEKLILTKKEEISLLDYDQTNTGLIEELSDEYKIQRIREVPAVNTKVLVLKDVIVNVKPMMDGGVTITVKKSNQIIRGLKNVTTRILNGIEPLSGNRLRINNLKKRIKQQNFLIQNNKTPEEIEYVEAMDILNEKQEKDELGEIQGLGILTCDVDGIEIKGELRALRDGSSNGKYKLEANLENAERLKNALAKVTIFLKEESRNRKVKKNGK